MNEQHEQHGDAAAVFDCLKYHASAGGEYEYRGTLAVEAFDRICTTLLDLKAQRDELLGALRKYGDHLPDCALEINHPMINRCTCGYHEAIANADAASCD